MLFDWSYSFLLPTIGDPAGFIQPLTRSHIQSNTYTYEEHFKTVRGSLLLSFFRRSCCRFFAIYSSFSNSFFFFFEYSTGFDVISFIIHFVLHCCVVVEFHSSHSFRSTPHFRTVLSKIQQVLTSSVSSFALCCIAVLLSSSTPATVFRHFAANYSSSSFSAAAAACSNSRPHINFYCRNHERVSCDRGRRRRGSDPAPDHASCRRCYGRACRRYRRRRARRSSRPCRHQATNILDNRSQHVVFSGRVFVQ